MAVEPAAGATVARFAADSGSRLDRLTTDRRSVVAADTGRVALDPLDSELAGDRFRRLGLVHREEAEMVAGLLPDANLQLVTLGAGLGADDRLGLKARCDRRGGERCDEALDLMIKLWTEPVTEHAGKHFTVKGARMDPKPVQTPHIPLIVGGFSAVALQRTARYGSGWLGFGLNPAITEQMLESLDAAIADAGLSSEDIDIVMMPGDDSEEVERAFADLGVDRLTPMVGLASTAETAARVEYLEKLAGMF